MSPHLPGTDAIRVVLIDDHRLVREGLRRIFEFAPEVKVVGEAGTGTEALQVCRALRPDAVVLDLNLPGLSGVEVTRQITSELPGTAVVILTVHDDTLHLDQAMQAGATSYCLKDVEPDVLVRTVVAAARGESYVAPELRRRAQAAQALSRRELEVLRMVAEGLSNREIGERLHISEKTARNHISNIFLKIGVTDRTQAALYAVQQGWIPAKPA